VRSKGSYPSNTEVKNEGNYACPPPIRLSFMYGDKFNFLSSSMVNTRLKGIKFHATDIDRGTRVVRFYACS
jgi:hypothetical protein